MANENTTPIIFSTTISGTRKGIKHIETRGRAKRKLSYEQAITIRTLFAMGFTVYFLSKLFSVQYSTAKQIVRNETYKTPTPTVNKRKTSHKL